MLANSQFLAVDQWPKKATVSTILLMHAVGVSVDQRHLFEARNIFRSYFPRAPGTVVQISQELGCEY